MPPSSDRLETARMVAGDEACRDRTILAAMLVGSSARGDHSPSSDIDLLLFHDGTAAAARAGRPARCDGYQIDITDMPAEGELVLEKLLGDPYFGGAIREGVVLLDRDGRLAAAKRSVCEQFMQPRWLSRRLAAVAPPVARNAREAADAAREGDAAELCRATIFALWTACDVWLVHCGLSPTRVRGLVRLAPRMPAEAERIMALAGIAGLGPEQAADHIRFLEASGGLSGYGGAVPSTVQDLLRMGYHREALHAVWSCFGLGIKERRAQRATSHIHRDNETAQVWLARLGWGRAMQAIQADELGRYAARLLWELGLPGGKAQGEGDAVAGG